MYYIEKKLSDKVLFLGVSKKTKGGMTAVLVSYAKYIENMHFIPTWKLGNQLTKGWYAFQAIVRMYIYLTLHPNVEIVHIHGAANASFNRCKLFISIAHRFHRKVILHEHAADFCEFYQKSEDKQGIVRTINACSRLIVLSQSWKEYFASIGVEDKNIVVLNNIVSPHDENFKPVPHNKLHLMYMGEVSKRKGCFDLLQVLADYQDYFKNKLEVRIGGNSVDGDINTFIKENHLDSFVKYEGWVSGQLKKECLEWEDVYILPSYNEGLPIAILEAMSYSHPVISTPVGGIPEILKNGSNGKLVQPGDKEAIAEAILFYIENKTSIQIEGENGYKVVQRFFPEKVLADLTNIYQQVLSE